MITLMKFEAEWCPACKAMRKSMVLEKFVEAHPGVKLQLITIEDAEEEVVEEAATLADDYEIEALPTIIFEDDKHGELAREEGGLSAKMLEAVWEAAQLQLRMQERREKVQARIAPTIVKKEEEGK